MPSKDFTFRESDHTYWLGEQRLPSVTEIIDQLGLISEFAKQERARLRGSLAHLACRYLFENRLDWASLSPETLGYVISCYRWLRESGFKVEQCEIAGYHPLLLYAGTFDVKGKHPKLGQCLLDLKTGVSCPITHQLQTAGYMMLEGRTLFRGCLHLQADGSPAKFYSHKDPHDVPNFQSCLNVYRLKEIS